ncbi:hypothetical protein EAH57_11250 [Acinetobacter sp. 2JN-4]|uniref:hypothetical protein n=1 Tax=Acinetobacter sp. 2JN-4 TaxID=2479844 RepID=UPI000EF9A4FF|nr:hypothetical protein [Acinetobacter sp. 2JN-4]RLZ07927.1 hypothetical protein EAH57_11250 [Acinetobacter sp. 2JN-4]
MKFNKKYRFHRITMNILQGCGLVLLSTTLSAMESLDDSSLQQVTGQAGADLSLKFSLNHDNNANFLCADLLYCRLALSLNNRYHDGTQDTYDAQGNRIPSATGRKQWLVMKGIQGTVNIQELKLDGEDVVYNGAPHAAIKLGFNPAKPIEFRNVGFQSLSIETDTCTESDANCSTGSSNLPGYLTPATPYGGSGFDANKERGFIGVNMNGNLSLTGDVKIFSCGAGHPRC